MERERERNPSERKSGQWTTVARRRPPPKPPSTSAFRTIFVNFLPLKLSLKPIFNIFSSHGPIEDIVMHEPNKKTPNHKYAFVKYLSPSSMPKAIKAENGRQIANFTIRVHAAKYDKPYHPPEKTPVSSTP